MVFMAVPGTSPGINSAAEGRKINDSSGGVRRNFKQVFLSPSRRGEGLADVILPSVRDISIFMRIFRAA